MPAEPLHIEELLRGSRDFERELARQKQACAPADFPWYPYGTLDNFVHLERLLTGRNRDLGALTAGGPVADVGAADGDLTFYLESRGVGAVDVVDYPPTNYNGLRGVRLLASHLGSSVAVHEKDLDSYFTWPREDYAMVFFLGILYHVKNPYYVLESLARVTRHCLLSTRIARLSGDRVTSIRYQPLAYLVAPDECNNDATNFWIFSEQGLRRILERTGWDVLDYVSVGDTRLSDPTFPSADERAFVLVRSRARA